MVKTADCNSISNTAEKITAKSITNKKIIIIAWNTALNSSSYLNCFLSTMFNILHNRLKKHRKEYLGFKNFEPFMVCR